MKPGEMKLSDSTSVQLLLEIGSKKGDIVTWEASLQREDKSVFSTNSDVQLEFLANQTSGS